MQTFDNQQNIPVIPPQPAAPRRRHVARWLTLATLILVVGSGSVLWLVRDQSSVVQAAPAATVAITTEGFVPQTIKIKKGQAITWINEDAQLHQVASNPYPTNDTLPALNSDEPLAYGDSFSVLLDEAGTFTYHDDFNPIGPKATIIVE